VPPGGGKKQPALVAKKHGVVRLPSLCTWSVKGSRCCDAGAAATPRAFKGMPSQAVSHGGKDHRHGSTLRRPAV
jgi:hypothetical protein